MRRTFDGFTISEGLTLRSLGRLLGGANRSPGFVDLVLLPAMLYTVCWRSLRTTLRIFQESLALLTGWAPPTQDRGLQSLFLQPRLPLYCAVGPMLYKAGNVNA
jgi:hypothetical protein